MGVHRDTIMRLGVRFGNGCTRLQDQAFRDLYFPLIEVDELWSCVGKKQRKLKPEDGPDKGDQYIFTALDAISKALICHRVGKRDGDTTRAFIWDLRERITNIPQISSDAFKPYEAAIQDAFGDDVHYGQIVKHYAGEPPTNAARGYSPGTVVGLQRQRVVGFPTRFQTSTSYVERSNLTFRMQNRRLTRLTNGFSKKLENHKAAIGMFVAHYNFCRVHEALRITPAMQLEVTDHVWDIGELVDVATGMEATPTPTRGRLEVVEGGVTKH